MQFTIKILRPNDGSYQINKTHKLKQKIVPLIFYQCYRIRFWFEVNFLWGLGDIPADIKTSTLASFFLDQSTDNPILGTTMYFD